MKSRQEDLFEKLVSFESHWENTVTVTALHRWTLTIITRDIKRNSESNPEVLCVNNNLTTYIRSIY